MAKQTQHPEASRKASWPQPNPALKDLEALVGEWNMELSEAAFLPNPSDTVQGSSSFSWAQDGAYLMMTQGTKPPNPPEAAWLMGRDEFSQEYAVLYYDARGVSRIYKMSFDRAVWKMWRDAPGFRQRFEGKVSADGKRIEARWEKSTDGSRWEQDFKLVYTKIG